MNYLAPTKEIEEMWSKIVPYLARNEKEDRGDGFKKGTPDSIIEMDQKIHEFFAKDTTM